MSCPKDFQPTESVSPASVQATDTPPVEPRSALENEEGDEEPDKEYKGKNLLKSEEIEFFDENGPYDPNDGVSLYAREFELDQDPYKREYKRQRDADIHYMLNEREQQRAEGELSEGEDEYFDEAKAQGYEEEIENFDDYPVMPHSH
ncbi:hypothetical protein H0H92_005002 [Tricholoma furcatifolium]|nr:hypothetical protein H0H92_005002 [Tricholoma furcatifolium]